MPVTRAIEVDSLKSSMFYLSLHSELSAQPSQRLLHLQQAYWFDLF